MNGSRLADTVSTHLMSSAAMPSSAAMILAISTSKPSGTCVFGVEQAEPGLVELGADRDRAGLVQLGHRRPGVELDVLLDLGRVLRGLLGLAAGLAAAAAGEHEAGGRQ